MQTPRKHENVIAIFSRTVPPGSLLPGIVLSASILLASCSTGGQVITRDSLLRDYESFADSVEQIPVLSAGGLPAIVTRWHGIENDLFSLMSEDSLSFDANVVAVTRMSSLGDRVRSRIFRGIDSSLHTYSDLVSLQQKLCLEGRSLSSADAAEACAFFSSLPDVEVWPDASLCETGYLDFLYREQDHAFRSWEEIETLLQEEDELYQCYLYASDWHPAETAEEIVLATSELMGHVAECLSGHDEESARLLAYMSARTNRRLQLCATQALAVMESGSCSSLEEAVSCISSCMAPFICFSPMLTGLRTEDQLAFLEVLGRRIPGAIALLESRQLHVVNHPDSLPNRIIKDYITYVINN